MPNPDIEEEGLLAGAGPLLSLEGVHHADGVPLATEQRLISLSAVPETGAVDFVGASPGAWLLKHVPWTQAETRIAAVAADRDTAAALNLPSGSPCLLIERRTWRGDDGITLVRQHFVGSAYDLIATFGPAKGPAGA